MPWTNPMVHILLTDCIIWWTSSGHCEDANHVTSNISRGIDQPIVNRHWINKLDHRWILCTRYYQRDFPGLHWLTEYLKKKVQILGSLVLESMLSGGGRLAGYGVGNLWFPAMRMHWNPGIMRGLVGWFWHLAIDANARTFVAPDTALYFLPSVLNFDCTLMGWYPNATGDIYWEFWCGRAITSPLNMFKVLFSFWIF